MSVINFSMKRYRPPLGHINNGVHLRIQQQQALATKNKKTYAVQLPPLVISPPKTARLPENDVHHKKSNISTIEALNTQKEIGLPTIPNINQFSQKLTNHQNNINNMNNINTISNITAIRDMKTLNPRNNSINLEKGDQPETDLPYDQNYVLSHMSDLLFEFEKVEIKNYNEIYYVRQSSPKMRVYTPVIPNFFQFVQNDHIAYRYQQLELLGKGAFGSVIKCIDHKNKRQVAVKMIRDQQKYHDQTRIERDVLKVVQGCPRTVRFLKSFTFRGFFCIVTELLYKDAYLLLRSQRYYGFNLRILQMITHQLSEALAYTHQKGVIHCDIKPENIMFTNRRKNAIKLVDFGCSCYVGKNIFSYIQSRYFRAPEVVLAMKYGTEIDVWSFACVLVELFTGKPLFPASSERDLLEMIVSCIGPPPSDFLSKSKRSQKFFDENGNIKKPAPRKIPTAKNYQQPTSHSVPSLETIFKDSNGEGNKELCDLVKQCLRWTPSDRITMEGILSHPFVTRTDIVTAAPPLPPISVR
ncbi:Dual specificity tyrosine-phosphorylation-regulated kinase 3 [Tritrichomonas foetus]|uniref:dual-specificity kinase n=1 Tax=Tritrichomonas foetus TaxID=1144522 RepID=A0A1J4KHA2_9EUKA|nr:Dual specificity tyrosine-phosphorylation-regulated kinase 3 [Tritrichomonas foetus]|eukprot:OHT10418.1 Dual specificity tyrosine-phosphorylation-regulated kinase 3 [Tritrichomonas foetus]